MEPGDVYYRRYGRKERAQIVIINCREERVMLYGNYTITGKGKEERLHGFYSVSLGYFLTGWRKELPHENRS